jgi:hypothetical protein
MSLADNRRRCFFKKVYGITPEQKPELLALQDWKCPLCGKVLTLFTGYVDHDRPPGKQNARVKGKTRGILCRECNAELGHYLKLKKKAATFEGYVHNPPASSLPTIVYSWDEFDRDVRRFLCRIPRLRYKGILAIPRGGLPLGVRLSHELRLPLLIRGQDSIRGKKDLLVVDEIADTGTTLSCYQKDTLTIHKHKNSRMTPTYWLHEVDKWVVYPWEKA